ncbi:MAG: hypothetical protein DRP71_07830 [Verrucomicrobia bacterium]|nr:MAG: hypothetical protein DRP71_07830 [Verrucomicrobiota bacterium]
MIIAIDFDGTIGDANRLKVRWIDEHLGLAVSSWQCSYTECLPLVGREAYDRMGRCVYDRTGTLEANQVPGALDALRALSRIARLHIVTARSEASIPSAREWLTREGVISCIEEIHSSAGSSKATICTAIGASILIDDDVRHLLDFEINGFSPILLQDGREDSPDYGPDVVFCRSWPDILERIDEIGEPEIAADG